MPRQALTIVEKQQRQLLRKLARGAGKRIAQQSAVIESRAWEEARQMQRLMDEVDERARKGTTVTWNQRARNLAEAVRSVTSVVRASFGLDQLVHYQYFNGNVGDRILSAKTNLKEILLDVNLGRFNDDGEANIRKNIALLKGATYHEVAHCLWTKDWKTYNFPPYFDLWEYFSAWNLLEDGRIETLLIEKSPIIRNYLLPLLYEVVLSKDNNGWSNVVDGAPFLIVRSYLPKGIQRSVLRACQESRRDMSILAEMHTVSNEYQRASGWDDQIKHVIRFHELLIQWNAGNPPNPGGGQPSPHGDHTQTEPSGDSPNEPTYRRVSKPSDSDWDTGEIVSYQAPPDQDPPVQEPQNEDTSSEASDDPTTESNDGQPDTPQNGGDTQVDGDGQADAQSDSNKQDSPTNGVAGAGEGASTKTILEARDAIEEAFNDSVTESVTSTELNEVISQYHKSLSRGIQKNTDVSVSDRIVNPSMITMANNLTLGMINALETVVVTPDPSWKYNMDDGTILDLEAFVNRDIGDDSYWVDKDGTGERGHDLAVSLLLDCSGSMSYYLTELGIVAYAIRRACDHFDIPCTTVLFGSDSELLWDCDEVPSLVTLPNMGGTCVGKALLDIPNHRNGKGRHLVVIFTDGAWGDVESVRPFFKEGEVSLVVGFGVPLNELQQRNADVAVNIAQLIDLPSEVEKGIARFF